MKFKITIHARSGAPPDALDLLFPRLGAGRDHAVRFAKPGLAILATLETDSPISMESDERTEVGRQVVWDIVQDVCEGPPGLRAAWFAVSPQR
jgi:hypothetical protein